jgi:hypothetical protein
MIITVCILLVYLVILVFGRLTSLLLERKAFEYEDLQKHFFNRSYNFNRLMAAVSELSNETLGQRPLTKIITINGLLLLFFLVALAWYTYDVTHVDLLLRFLTRGLTIELDQNEQNYLLQHWPWIYLDESRNAGRELYVGGTVVQGVAFLFTLFVVLSAASSISALNTLTLIRRLGAGRLRFGTTLVRITMAVCIALLIDVVFLGIFLVAIVVGGKALNTSLEEVFKADASKKMLEYGFSIVVGDAHVGETIMGIGLIVPEVDFNALSHDVVQGSRWIYWIFPSAGYEGDAAALCRRYDIRATCRDRLRSLYFRRLLEMNGLSSIPREMIRNLYNITALVACGNNMWSPLLNGSGAKEAMALAFPWFASLAVVFLARFLIIPWLAAVLFLDFALVKVGRYLALSSERGLSIVARHGATLLASPPIIAIVLLAAFARRVCN